MYIKKKIKKLIKRNLKLNSQTKHHQFFYHHIQWIIKNFFNLLLINKLIIYYNFMIG